MIIIIAIFLLIFFIISPVFRCAVLNLPKYVIHKAISFGEFIVYKEYNIPIFLGMTLWCGCSEKPMGSGKTLALSNTIVSIYNQYNDKIYIDKETKQKKQVKIMVLSNITLKEIPYVEFKGFDQITQFVSLKNKLEEENPNFSYFLYVLLDESSVFLNSRNFKNNFTIEQLNDLTQVRHNQIQMLGFTSQRFEMTDVNIRRLSSYVKTCNLIDIPFLNKKRFLLIRTYISRDLEEATSELMIKPIAVQCKYISDKKGWHYGGYDTHQMAGKIQQKISEGDYLSDEDFNKSITNEDRKGINTLRQTRKYKKSKK